jgi:hypothetical protein
MPVRTSRALCPGQVRASICLDQNFVDSLLHCGIFRLHLHAHQHTRNSLDVWHPGFRYDLAVFPILERSSIVNRTIHFHLSVLTVCGTNHSG